MHIRLSEVSGRRFRGAGLLIDWLRAQPEGVSRDVSVLSGPPAMASPRCALRTQVVSCSIRVCRGGAGSVTVPLSASQR